MDKNFGEKVLEFYDELLLENVSVPEGYQLVNPLQGNQKKQVHEIMKKFYQKFYFDFRKRRVIFGSSPARRGSAVIGVPFESAEHLKQETGISIDNFAVSSSSSNFLFEVIQEYGGFSKFYSDFYLNFICPLGIIKTSNGKEVNCNYYENKDLQEALYSFMICSIKKQIEFGIDTSVCYCIGSGENFKFLQKINQEYHFFQKILPLEHPRFIMQYHSDQKESFLKKYLDALSNHS